MQKRKILLSDFTDEMNLTGSWQDEEVSQRATVWILKKPLLEPIIS